MRVFPPALRAYPQTVVPFVQVDFSKIHGRPVIEAPDCGNHFQIILISVLARQEVSARDAVVDEAIRLGTGMCRRLPGVLPAVGKTRPKAHLHVVLLTKGAKCFAWLACRHTTSLTTHFNFGSRGCGTRWFQQISKSYPSTCFHTPASFWCQESVQFLFSGKIRKTG